MIGLTALAVIAAWFSGFGSCYGVFAHTDDDRQLGKWIGRFMGVVAMIFALLALTVKK